MQLPHFHFLPLSAPLTRREGEGEGAASDAPQGSWRTEAKGRKEGGEGPREDGKGEMESLMAILFLRRMNPNPTPFEEGTSKPLLQADFALVVM